MKLEVHHIVPEAEGGGNSLDNAIVLCFDCHTDAGHYNTEHPRGTKFSRSELRSARDRWHATVASGTVEPAEDSGGTLQSRYFLCRNFNVIQEVVGGDVSRLPVPDALLLETPSFLRLRAAIGQVDERYHRKQVWGNDYADDEAYLAAHPDAEVLQRAGGDFPYFRAVREVSREEIHDRVAEGDQVTRHLLRTVLPSDRIARALTYYEACGSDRIQEIYILRPLWLALLAIENVGEEPVTLDQLLVRELDPGDDGVARFADLSEAKDKSVSMPGAPLRPGETVVIPIGILLPGFSPSPADLYEARVQSFDMASSQTTYRSSFSRSDVEAFEVWGKMWMPTAVRYRREGNVHDEELHELDPTNVYAIDRTWAIGSCPHAFLLFPDRTVYHGELFARAPRLWQKELVELPPECVGLEIAELEDEESFVVIDHPDGLISTHLLRGMSVVVEGDTDRTIRIWGAYFPVEVADGKAPEAVTRNELVRTWLSGSSRAARLA